MTKLVLQNMSAAIMHNNASIYHECGEFILKTQTTINNNNNNNNNICGSSNNTMLAKMNQLNSSSSAVATVLNSNALNSNINNFNSGSSSIGTPVNGGLMHQHMNVINSAHAHHIQHHPHHQQQQQQQPQQQEQHDQKSLIHNALTRVVSHPTHGAANVVSLMNTLIENLGNVNAHRKLERTQSEPLPQQVNTSRYKTELCRPFEEAGECKYGEKCQFAHGYHELRNLQRHPKYKTEYCRTFHSVGFCPYGPRCHFVHNADEARAMMQQQQQHQQMLQQQQQQQNRTNFNKNLAQFTRLNQSQIGHLSHHPLPLSPPLSMSTGSDRASPTGSLSLSPTSSMASFPFVDQISPGSSVFPNTFSYNHSPPASPNSPMSPISTPPPSTHSSSMVTQSQNHIYVKPILPQNIHIIENKSSSPIAITGNCSIAAISASNSASSEEARLPVFNRLSSTVDALSNLAI